MGVAYERRDSCPVSDLAYDTLTAHACKYVRLLAMSEKKEV